MSGLAARFAEHLGRSGWLAGGDGVVVGVSGGVDSMTLLHLMRFRPAEPAVRLHAAHIDHRMRPGSAEDAAWVGRVCDGWGIPFHLRTAGGPVATEARGRELRYRFFEEVRSGIGDNAVTMTAHTADDQAETVLFRAARGSGPRGLAGIRAERSPSVLRPLLPFRRAEIEAFASERGVPFREDPSNADLRWTRNRLRHSVLPALEEAVPGAGAALAALAGTSALEGAALRELLDDRISALAVDAADGAEIVLDRAALLALAPPVLTLVLRRAVHRAGGDPGRSATATLVRFAREARTGRRIHVAGGVAVERQSTTVRIVRREPGLASGRPSGDPPGSSAGQTSGPRRGGSA